MKSKWISEIDPNVVDHFYLRIGGFIFPFTSNLLTTIIQSLICIVISNLLIPRHGWQ